MFCVQDFDSSRLFKAETKNLAILNNMGNISGRSRRKKKDFVSELPPNAVAKIFSFLSLDDALNSLLVSRRWKDIIQHLKAFWTASVQELGLSPRSILRSLEHFSNPRDLFLGVIRYQDEVRRSEFVPALAICYPQYPVADCFIKEESNIMVRRERFDGGTHLKVEEIVSGGVIYTWTLCSVPLSEEEASVLWVHYSKCECLYWLTATGNCKCFDIFEGRELHSINLFLKPTMGVKNPVLTECEEKLSMELSPVECEKDMVPAGSEDDIESEEECVLLAGEEGDIAFGICQDCSLAIVCQVCLTERVQFSRFNLQVTRLGNRDVDTMEMVNIKLTISHNSLCQSTRKLFGMQQKIFHAKVFGSGSQSAGLCEFHSALLQNRGYTSLISMTMDRDSKEVCTGEMGDPEMKIDCDCINCSYHLPGAAGEMVISSSGLIFGQIYGRSLYVWRNRMNSGLELLSKADIALEGHEECSFSELVVLGDNLSIVRHLGAEVSDDTLCVVYTESGEVLSQIKNWMQSIISIPPPRIITYLCGKKTQKWLSDFTSQFPSLLLMAVYDNGGTLGFLLVESNQKMCEHWMYAINYTFQK